LKATFVTEKKPYFFAEICFSPTENFLSPSEKLIGFHSIDIFESLPNLIDRKYQEIEKETRVE
jgi:hypothetical protein